MTIGRLALVLDRDAIVRLAGPLSYERGVNYARGGRVGAVTGTADRIEAVVQGEVPYAVWIALEGTRVDFDCTCPMGESGTFCKHCVALALAWSDPSALLEPAGAATPPRQRKRPIEERTDPVPAYLASLDRESLVGLITSEADRDPDLGERLRMRAVSAAPRGKDIRYLKAAIDRATRVDEFLRYGDVPDYARRAHLAADAVAQLMSDGSPDLAIDLAERALRRLERALEVADDSDGLIGDLLRRFQSIHHEACRAARPDPVSLAERLVRWELDGDWDVFRGAAERYADVLGEAGLATYRSVVEARWARMAVLGPADADLAFEGDRFNVTYAMESLARASGDVDALIAVMARDLSSAYEYLEIAEVCRDAGRDDEALDWAERGVQAFPVGTDVRLREFLADSYLRHSRTDDAMGLMWAELCERLDLPAYQRLRGYAERIDAWEAWRPRAIAEVRRSAEAAMTQATTADAATRVRPTIGLRRHRNWELEPDGSALVDILVWEGELDEAWSEARRLGCTRSGWLRLARSSEESHPDDAVAVYRNEVQALLKVSDKRVYAEAVGYLRRMKRLMDRSGRAPEFAAFAREIRAANARRPAFLALFDAARLTSS